MSDVKPQESLSNQTLLLEEAETQIKLTIKTAILINKQWKAVKPEIEKTIYNGVKRIENESFRQEATKSLQAFAVGRWSAIREELRGVNLQLLPLIAIALNEKLNNLEFNSAIRKLQTSVTKLKGVPYREIAQPLSEYAESYIKKVKTAFYSLARASPKDSDSFLSLRNLSEMQVRQDKRKGELEALLARGIKLVWISTHANASERCAPWQGKLYSLDTSYGEIDGIKYQPLSDATDRYYTTKKGKSYKNGIISGFNCRHTLIPYKKGNSPVHIDESTIKKEREINAKQRYLERAVIYYKEKALIIKGVDAIEYKKNKAKAKEWEKRYIEYSRKNDVAYYPSRTKLI